VKLHGLRVEPAAVEAVLERHPAVAGAAVVLRRAGLVAYVVPAQGTVVDGEALLAVAARALPAGAVPAAVVELAELPLTVHGKLDTAALPEPGASGDRARREAPATPAEAALAEAWQAALGLSELGVTDGFFKLGGDSIAAIKAVAEARRRGLSLTVDDLFEDHTIRSIAARLDAAGPAEHEAPPAGPAASAGDFPDAGLDEEGLARLLASMGIDSPGPEGP
jgi:hypothetical protein